MNLKPRGKSIEQCRDTAIRLREIARRFELTVPIVTLDLETTGTLREYDRICEIAAVRVRPDLSYNMITTLVNPLMPIAPEATEKNKITDAMVADAPQWGEVGLHLKPGLVGELVLFGFNMRGLDIPVLEREYRRIGAPIDLAAKPLIDPFVIAQEKLPRTLEALYWFYCGRRLAGAHEAAADIEPPIEIFLAQLAQYSDLPQDIAGLAALCERRRPEFADRAGKFHHRGGRLMVAFGQRMGTYLDEIDTGFLLWVLDKDFEESTKDVCRAELRRRSGPQQGSLLQSGAGEEWRPF